MKRKPLNTITEFRNNINDDELMCIVVELPDDLEQYNTVSFHDGLSIFMKIYYHESPHEVLGIVRRSVFDRDIDRYLKQYVANTIIIADYISNASKIAFKRHRINHADLSGDLFLITQQVYIDISTSKSSISLLQENPKSFNTKELIVLDALLADPNLLKLSVRDMAKEIGISKTKVFDTLKKMESLKIAIKEFGRRRIINPEKFIECYVNDTDDDRKDYAYDRLSQLQHGFINNIRN